ncbi:MAG: AAA family ATPase [Rhizomicrobium sp.]
MSESLEGRAIAASVAKLMEVLRPDSEAGRRLKEWARERETLLGFRYEDVVRPGKRTAKNADAPLSRAAWKRLREGMLGCAAQAPQSRAATNALALAEALRLPEIETRLFATLTAILQDSAFEQLCERIVASRALTAEEVIAATAGLAAGEVAVALATGLLSGLGLVDGLAGRPGHFDLYVPYNILRALRGAGGLAQVEQALLGDPVSSPLTPEDFAHVARERDFARDLLRGALAARARGVHVLLYGAPGSGKTELAKVLAREAGARLFAVGAQDPDGEEPNRWERLGALKLGERILSRRGGALLLFDEMEDVQQSGEVSIHAGKRIRRAGSKAHFNRFLENAAVPVIWTANVLDEFDPAFLRRMSFAFEMKAPPRHARARLWARSARERDLDLDDAQADALARHHATVPGLARNAVAAVSLAKADGSQLAFVVAGIAKAMEGMAPRATRPGGGCERALLNADHDLEALERNIASMPRDVSFCFHGPSGTGKSLYARALAAQMGLDALEMRGSDFLSKWVGESEKKIASAFDEAASDGRFLIIDEAESLFWSRGEASRSWEVSLVNEFLVGLEHHAWPVAITTNHIGRIDPAALRRFVFKVKFEAMTAAQAALAFDRFFCAAAPARLGEVAALTPGDFAVVKKQLAYLGGAGPERIVEMLEAEVRAKANAARRIGF